jgi:hypothetical protein
VLVAIFPRPAVAAPPLRQQPQLPTSLQSVVVVPPPRRQSWLLLLADVHGPSRWASCQVLTLGVALLLLRAFAGATSNPGGRFSSLHALHLTPHWYLFLGLVVGRGYLVVGRGCSELQPLPSSLTVPAFAPRCRHLGVSLRFPSLQLSSRMCGSGLGGHWRKLCLAFATTDNGCTSFVTYPTGGVLQPPSLFGLPSEDLACSGATVGDSHKGPLNNQGETRLKPAKNAKHKSTRTPKAHTQHNHDPGGPRSPPGQHSGCPSSEIRLARGIDAPLGEVRLARGLYAPLGRGPPRSRAEHPLGRGPLRSRAPTRAFPTFPRAPVPARAYEHLML